MDPLRKAALIALLAAISSAACIGAAELMPAAQQTALVHKYCTVCHTDASKKGGLSLEHFDAAHVAPSLAAMMLSKLTGGVLIETARAVASNPAAAATVDKRMRTGAMGASGIPIPDKTTIDALIRAFARQSEGASAWTVEREQGITASILVEKPTIKGGGEAEHYRLVASCNPANRQGEMLVAWAPAPQAGSLNASIDGGTAVRHVVPDDEVMGNAAVVLGGSRSSLPLPGESLTIRDLFPGETVSFSFANLPQSARQTLNECFQSSPGLARK